MVLLFSIFASIAIVSAIMVIQSRNPVHSVLFLVLVFMNAAALLILLGLDFFAMVLLVVYVGAIAVLFLFVVMMLNIKLAEISEQKLQYLPIGGLIGFLFLFQLLTIIDNDICFYDWKTIIDSLDLTQWSILIHNSTNIEAVGLLMYTHFFTPFLLAGMILLVAMIGTIVLTMHRGANIKVQDPSQQNARDYQKTVVKQRKIYS